MIWLHIGMPKTGTTALQMFFRNAGTAAALQGSIHYIEAGRKAPGRARGVISHNPFAFAINRNKPHLIAQSKDRFCTEIAEHGHKNCVISSEMFYGRSLSGLHEHLFRHVDQAVHVIVYLRRFDDFIEADYKQRVKNGRMAQDYRTFVASRLEMVESDPDFLNYNTVFDALERDLPGCVIHPQLYLRNEMKDGDIVADCLNVMGIYDDTLVSELEKIQSNRSLSRLASEALGVIASSQKTFDKKKHRQLLRKVQHSNNPLMFGKGDVLTLAERKKLNTTLEIRNEAVRKKHFPKRKRLFPQASAKDSNGGVPPGDKRELAQFQDIMQEILTLASYQ